MSLQPVQMQAKTLYGSGATAGDTTVVLSDFLDINGAQLSAATDFGGTGYCTIEPNTTNEEAISFSGITYNANGTATLTGVKRCLFKTPFTETSGLGKTHVGGTTLVVTNSAAFYDKFSMDKNDETITGLWTFSQLPLVPTSAPTSTSQVASVAYAQSLVAPSSYWSLLGGNIYFNTGNVGIGISNPASLLEVGGTTNGTISSALENLSTGTSALAQFAIANSANNFSIYKYSTGYTGTVVLGITTKASANALYANGELAVGTAGNNILRLSTNNTSRMTISGAGAIDFGAIPTIPTTAPTTAGQVLALDSGAKVPAVDCSQVTKLPAPALIQTTRALDAASGSVNYAHGLGVIPSWVRLDFIAPKSGFNYTGMGVYNGTNQYGMSMNANANVCITSATQIFIIDAGGGDSYAGIVSVDATNITIAWTKTGNGIAGVTANIILTAGK